MDDLPTLTTQTVIGITVAISGNVLISLALNLQKLAHKRLNAERNSPNSPLPPDSILGRRQNLDGQDADSDTIITENPTPWGSDTPPETRPLLSVNHRSNHYTTPQGGKDPHEPQATGFLARLFRTRHQGRKKEAFLLPIDIMPEDAALDHPRIVSDAEDENESAYLKSKLWWTGFFLMNVGELGNFISYAFAPASVVAPLGTFALIANCAFAPIMLGEHFRKRDFFGICIAIVGAVTVVLSSNASDTRLYPEQLIEAILQTPFLIYAGCYVVGAIILGCLSHGTPGRTYVFIDVGLCALFGGFTVLSTKALSTLITLEWYGIFAEWITYPLILTLVGTGVGQVRYLNRALMRFDGKTVIPIQFVLFTLSAITGSAILYGDFKRAGFHTIVTFLYGCGATFIGVFVLTNGSGTSQGESGQQLSETFEDETRLGMGTIGKRRRATLVLPSGIEEAPALRRKKSGVALVGISSAQQLLLVHSPSLEPASLPREYNNARGEPDREIPAQGSYGGGNRSLYGFSGRDSTLSESPRSPSTWGDRILPGQLRTPQSACMKTMITEDLLAVAS